ncbi:MAG: type I-E CRISPR-associated protein Cse2/CasB, partial [Candidatus Lokiarchaeota archaeon]
SIEKRFITLLKCNPEDLAFHMRQTISLAKSEKIPINWNELFFDLKRWPYESRFPPYEKWAQSFWKNPKEKNNKNK